MAIRQIQPATARCAGRQQSSSRADLQQQLTAVQLDRITAFHRQRIKRYDWNNYTPEQQRAIRDLVDSAAICLRRGTI